MWKVTLLFVFLGKAIGQDFLRTYPLRGGLSPTAEERQYLKPEPLVLRDWSTNSGDYRPTVASASARVYWPFDRMPSPGDPGLQEPYISAQAYAQPQNSLTYTTPLKNTIERYPSENFERELDDPYPVRFPGSVRTGRRRRPNFRRPQTIIYDQELQNPPEPVGIPINNFGTPPYTNFIPRPDRIHRPDYFNPRGINYAPTFNNYIPITRFHHDQKPDGEYNVAFETANGIAQSESGFVKRIPVYNYKSGRYEEGSANVKTGSVSWTSPEGIPFSYRYTADEQGFKVVGDHIPPSVSGGQVAAQSATATVPPSPPFNRNFDINSYEPVIPYNPIAIQRNYK